VEGSTVRRSGLALLILTALALTAAARGQGTLHEKTSREDIPLEVKGAGVQTIQVDKVMTVKVDQLVISAFPVTVIAPPGDALHFWTCPAGVQAVDRGNRLEITAAPKGTVTVNVKSISTLIDWEKKTSRYVTRFGSVTFQVLDAADDPKPPVIPMPPDKPDKPEIPKRMSPELRVLLVGNDKAGTEAQRKVWASLSVKQHLDARCAKDSASGRPEWRKLDRGAALPDPNPTMTRLWSDVKPLIATAPLPLIVVVIDQTGKVYSLPESIQATMDLIDKSLSSKPKE
jgi:hypothetical protein